jgi:hypothetical protein
MARITAIRIEQPSAGAEGDGISPALQSWLRNVIVPALVREYLAERKKINIATPSEDVRQFPVDRTGSIQ